jgi:hypothetical protein
LTSIHITARAGDEMDSLLSQKPLAPAIGRHRQPLWAHAYRMIAARVIGMSRQQDIVDMGWGNG